MISIRRAKCPNTLMSSKSKIAYKLKSVVRVLHKMQNGKCCYCESYIPIDGHMKAVEHFNPQSIFREKANDWKNLLLACPQCNGAKSDKFPAILTNNENETKIIYISKITKDFDVDPLLIDPSEANLNPEDYIGFIVDDREDLLGTPIAKNDDDRGRITITVTGIDNMHFLKLRKKFYIILLKEYSLLLQAGDDNAHELVEMSKRQFTLYMGSNYYFSAFAREFARYKRLDDRFSIIIPNGN